MAVSVLYVVHGYSYTSFLLLLENCYYSYLASYTACASQSIFQLACTPVPLALSSYSTSDRVTDWWLHQTSISHGLLEDFTISKSSCLAFEGSATKPESGTLAIQQAT